MHKTEKLLHISDKAAVYYPHDTNKNNEETDHFAEFFSPKTETAMTLFVCGQFLTSRHSTCLFKKGMNTSFDATSGVSHSVPGY